jgi:hypothetical protein
MKPIHYVRKYQLDQNDKFNHQEFIADFTIEFISLLEVGNSSENIKGFENAVRAIRMKWDGISNKTRGQLPEKLWNYFYATVIAKMREDLFPEIMQSRAEERERIKREREERKRFYDNGDFFESWFRHAFISSLFSKSSAPTEELKVLGLDEKATEVDIKTSYRELSKRHHPDLGGKQSKFVEITEAKNKCLAWCSSK